jgi:hypothetical protein
VIVAKKKWEAPFPTAEEGTEVMLGFFERLGNDATVGPQIRELPMIVQYQYSDPDFAVWYDSRNGDFVFGSGDPPEAADVIGELPAGLGHLMWLSRVNSMLRIVRGDVKLSGNRVSALLRLAPINHELGRVYEEYLRDSGRTDWLEAGDNDEVPAK